MKRPSLVALLFATALPAHADLELSWNPATSTATVGETVDVQLEVSGVPVCTVGNPANFPVGCTLGAFDASITYDPTIVTPGPDPFTFGNSLGDAANYFGSVDTSLAGQINLVQSSFLTGPQLLALQDNGSFSLGTFQFTGVAIGQSDLVAESADFTDALGAVMYNYTAEAGVIKVVAAPEPPHLSLLAAACALTLGLLRRRRVIP